MPEELPVLISCKPLKKELNGLKKINITSENDFTIGRSLQSSVNIPLLVISRNHCRFKKDKESWYIEDCSACGIEVNGVKMGKGKVRKLETYDTIQLDPLQELVYKFLWQRDCSISKKRIKLEANTEPSQIIDDVKIKLKESQNCEIQHLEDKIEKQKQIQKTNMLLKDHLHQQMARKLEQLEHDFASQIDNLEGEQSEVERQRMLLIEKKDAEITAYKKEMETKIQELMEQIKTHNEIESELVLENKTLKEKLEKEREDFLKELNRESSSKQDLLDKLHEKIQQQEEMRLKEKAELEKLLQEETEQLKLAKEKELKELAEQKKKRELELTEELNRIKETLEKQIELTEKQKSEANIQLAHQVEQMKKLSDEDKVKMDQLIQEREEIKKSLLAAEDEVKKTVEELKSKVQAREVELAALAVERIQKQSEQSGEVINSLQEQLEKVKNQLKNVESEKEKLLENFAVPDKLEAGPSKQETLKEVGQIMENELQCSICAELFVSATTLNCAHTFCKYCITMWKKKKKDCPICRAPITSECKSIVLDSFIDKMVQNLTDDMRQKREDMLRSRKEVENLELQTSAGSSRGRSGSDSESEDSSDPEEDEAELWADSDHSDYPDYSDYHADHDYFGESDFDDTLSSDSGSDNNTDLAPAPDIHGAAGSNSGRRRGGRVPGLPGSYYGGYGRCFRCGARGHWAPGCPLRNS